MSSTSTLSVVPALRDTETDISTPPAAASVRGSSSTFAGRLLAALRGRPESATGATSAANGTVLSAGARVWVGVSSLALRGLVVVTDLVLVLATATVVIPALGAFLHHQAGLDASVKASGVFALWTVPYVFLVVMLGLAELLGMRALWRASGRGIAAIRARVAQAAEVTR